ncbi:MAG: DMT family transporter [Haliscomenobacter sp.]|nr:DMT family transporter [Haliscomenobacter sp.]
MLEPIFFKEDRWAWKDLGLSMLALGGVALVLPDWDIRSHGFQGAILGILSGATFALLAILNRVFVKSYSSIQIAFHQDLSACLFLCVPFFMLAPAVSPGQLALIALLGVVFTAFSHALFIHGMRHVPARSASLIATLEPVYGIVAAAVFLSETPSLKTMAGGMVILGVAVYETFRKR